MRSRLSAVILFAAIVLPAAGNAQPVRKNIHGGWEFRQGRGYNWYPATVPGVVHTDLMDNGIIEDPFFRLNERAVQWVDKEDWVYKTTFEVDPDLFAKENITIVFEGLDTYADVTLNGESLFKADNMFREWRADVKALLKEKGNELQVFFHSPIKITLPMWEATPWRNIIESGNDQSANGGLFNARVGVFVRKAGYHFGWDWGPRLVTSGIWKPVYIEGWNDARIANVFYRQAAVSKQRAEIEVTVSIDAVRDISDAEIIVTNRTDGKRVARYKGRLGRDHNQTSLKFSMNDPKLWWTNGLGEQHLYDFEVEVKGGGKVIDRHEQKLGIRSLRVVVEPDRWGESFYFELNGVPVFMKGANYIPCDNFLPRVTDEIYEKTVRDAAAAHMNMLRVWGGGIYENDIFYDLCDKYGILVWQDFMFSCALYPAEGELMENIKEEARQNVCRLRNHTCMALWCGNNECLDMWFHWGVRRRYEARNPGWAAIQWRQFTDLYYDVLPAIVEQHHPGICYRKSSPYSDDYGLRSDSIGDYHDWDVWGQALEFDRFNHQKSRFFSEYGFQGFPSLRSIQRFAPEPRDRAVTSEVMLSHQRAGSVGNQKINSMLQRDYGEPCDFGSFTYMSQLMQADAMKTAMEAHRRQMPRCMGSLIWQHNDCWPVASWSSRDYYGAWKAQQYAICRAFDDILISPVVEQGALKIYAVSDRLKPVKGVLEVRVMNMQGEGYDAVNMAVTLEANGSAVIWESDYGTLLDENSVSRFGMRKENAIIHAVFTESGGRRYANNYFPAKHKDMEYPRPHIQTDVAKITAGEAGYEVTVWSDAFARGVYLTVDSADDYFVTDNFFDLLPGEKKTLRVLLDEDVRGIESRLRITSYADERK